ncbi:MAG: hypothetical protein U0228_18055 [Myxococcaceae bacterium]
MISRLVSLTAVVLVAAGCSGTSGDDGGMMGTDSGAPFDAGPQPIKYTKYTRRSAGWPSGARIVGAAVVNGVLYAAHSQGLSALKSTETDWTTETSPLTGDLKPTSLQRVDQALVLTAAGATGGGIFTRELDAAWVQVMGPPMKPMWGLTKKGTEWLLVATGALYAAPDLPGPWARRSALNTPVFAAAPTHFMAAAGQQKLFASSLGAADGGLFESSDLGATWSSSTVRGRVDALGGTGPVVLVATTGADGGQQRSDNYGNTFRPATMPVTGTLDFYVTDGTTFWVGGSDGLAKSSDQGVSFTPEANGLPSGEIFGLWLAGSYVIADTADGPYVNQLQ